MLTVAGGPFVIMAVCGAAVLLSSPLGLLSSGTDTSGDTTGAFTDDIGFMDPFGYLATVALAGFVAVVMVVGPRVGTRAPR